VLPQVNLSELAFAEPHYLWLLVVPAVLLGILIWRLAARRADARRLRKSHLVPVRERLAVVSDFPFWLSLLAAATLIIFALARPHGPATVVREGGLDIVVLADGSASMRVQDVSGDRWQRAMRFVRTLGDALGWKNDRISMALFAHIATPQIRLTKDPNTLFFFLDNLQDAPPFRIEDDTTWDTNLELGIHWGLRVIERDEELLGKSPNAQMFILLTDGEAWSGEVENALKLARQRRVPVFVVGVGTLGGGLLPVVRSSDGQVRVDPETPTSSRLDRASLQRVAAVGGGQYFELDRDGDRFIANSIIDLGRRQSPTLTTSEEAEDLYWYFLGTAGVIAAFGLIFLRERSQLWIQVAGLAVILVGVLTILS
jgi:Ca-activated chloride channel family protein